MSYIMFDGATTTWKTIPQSSFSGEQQGERQGSVNRRAEQVADEFEDLKSSASDLAESALTYIQDCIDFAVDPGTVNYNSPGFVAPVITDIPSEVSLTVNLSPPNNSVESFPNMTVNDLFQEATGSPPAAPDNPFPVPTVDTTTLPSVPVYSGEGYNLDPGAVPSISPPTFTPLSPPPALVFDLSPLSVTGTFVAPEDYTLPEGLADGEAEITAAKAALEGAINNLPTLPSYASVFPEIMGCVGGLLSGFTFTTALDAEDRNRNAGFRQAFSARVQDLWAGVPLPAAAQSAQSVWLTDEEGRQVGQGDVRSTVFQALSSNEAKVLGFKLGAAAHEVQMDLVLGQLKAELTYAAAVADSTLDLYRAAGAAYKGAIALFESRAEQAELSYVQEGFRTQQYEILGQDQLTKAQVNKAKADVFKVGERVKRTDLDVVKAQFGVEGAKLKAFDMSKRADEAKTAELKAGLEEFKAELLEWSGSARAIAAQYELWSSQAKSVQKQNEAIVKSERGKIDRYRADEAGIREVAAHSAGSLAKIQKDLVSKGTEFEETKVKNAVEGFKDKLEGTLLARDLRNIGMGIGIKAGNLEGKVEYNRQLTSYARSVSDAAYRAAAQTLQANETLVRAYATAQTAAGNAQAALEAGKWSGWNVTATAKAMGTVSGAFTYGSQTQRNRTNNVTQSSSERISA